MVFAVGHLKTSVFRNDELSLTIERGERCRAVGARDFSRSMQSVGRACAAPNGACTGAERCAQDHDYTLESSWHLYSSTVEGGSPRTRFSVSLILSVTAWSWKDLFQTEIISSCSEHAAAICRHFAAYLRAGKRIAEQGKAHASHERQYVPDIVWKQPRRRFRRRCQTVRR